MLKYGSNLVVCKVYLCQYFRVKLQFKYQKYTRGWAVGWVVLMLPGLT